MVILMLEQQHSHETRVPPSELDKLTTSFLLLT